MQLDSVRALKHELLDPRKAHRPCAAVEGLSVPAGHPDAVAVSRPALALG